MFTWLKKQWKTSQATLCQATNKHANLHVVRQKYGTGKTASDATGNVDDADAETAGKLLEISHDKELKCNGDDKLQQTTIQRHTLVWNKISTLQ